MGILQCSVQCFEIFRSHVCHDKIPGRVKKRTPEYLLTMKAVVQGPKHALFQNKTLETCPKVSVGNVYEEIDFKPCLTKQLLNTLSFGLNWVIELNLHFP